MDNGKENNKSNLLLNKGPEQAQIEEIITIYDIRCDNVFGALSGRDKIKHDVVWDFARVFCDAKGEVLDKMQIVILISHMEMKLPKKYTIFVGDTDIEIKWKLDSGVTYCNLKLKKNADL